VPEESRVTDSCHSPVEILAFNARLELGKTISQIVWGGSEIQRLQISRWLLPHLEKSENSVQRSLAWRSFSLSALSLPDSHIGSFDTRYDVCAKGQQSHAGVSLTM